MDRKKELSDIQNELNTQILKLNNINIDIMNSAMNVGESKCFNYIDYIVNELKKCNTLIENTNLDNIESTGSADVCFS